MGKVLAIYTDCCYSGQWVVDCAKCLDEMGIGACGHQTMQKGISIRVIASCEPNQKATVEHFVVLKGIEFDDYYKTLFFMFQKSYLVLKPLIHVTLQRLNVYNGRDRQHHVLYLIYHPGVPGNGKML